MGSIISIFAEALASHAARSQGPSNLLLTVRAIEARTLAERDGANRGAALEARLPFAIIDSQQFGKASRLATRITIAAEGGAATADRLAQHLLCRADYPAGLAAGDFAP